MTEGIQSRFEPVASVGETTPYRFSPTLCELDDTIVAAWIEIDGEDAQLVTNTDDNPIESGTFRRPLLVSGDSDAHLFWSRETDDSRWPIMHARLSPSGISGDPQRITDGTRRPLDLTGCGSDDGVAVVWESTCGSGSEIRLARHADGVWTSPEPVSSSDVPSAHDAAIASDQETQYLLYTALRDGWYEIEGRIWDGTEWTDAEVLSSQPSPASYPTVTTGSRGGAWVGWVTYQLPIRTNEPEPYGFHQRRAAQHSFFHRDRQINVLHWDGSRIEAPLFSLDWEPAGQANRMSGRVFPADGGTRPRLVTDDVGNLWLLWLDYEDMQSRPRIAYTSLQGDRWAEKRVSGWAYGDAERIHCSDNRSSLRIATSRDTRSISRATPYTDPDYGTVDVGSITLPAIENQPRVALRSKNRWVHTRHDLRNPELEDPRSIQDDRQLVFLNYHRHTDLSICVRRVDGEPDFNARIARDLMQEDSLAFTDHCYDSDPVAQYHNERAMRFFHWPGRFVSVPSYEWTGTVGDETHYGHFNVHWFEDASLPPCSSPMWEEGGLTTPEELWDALDGSMSVTIPHHLANRMLYFDPAYLDNPEMVPVVELFQTERGSCECRDGPGTTEYADVDDPRHYVQSQLSEGHKLGFVAGGEHRCLSLTGVWVDEVSRRGIYEALRDRRCFASSGTTLALDSRIGDTAMGGTLLTNDQEITYELEGSIPDTAQRIEIVYNNSVIVAKETDNDEITLAVDVQLDGSSILHWVYARVLIQNGEVAWTSPIWIEDGSE